MVARNKCSQTWVWKSVWMFVGLFCVGAWRPLKNWGSHIDASHSRQPLVKGERLVRYEVNAVMLVCLKSCVLHVPVLFVKCCLRVTRTSGQSIDRMHPRTVGPQISTSTARTLAACAFGLRVQVCRQLERKNSLKRVSKHERDSLHLNCFAARWPSRFPIGCQS